ncbi:MAG: alpha/beta hydrolase [Chloroflexi bacterium]|nr:alpha/beta hydrolase [Chloroflexota bacterium]MDA1228083.1 alpha/beta hydrolase [Chloroflexota bacterium]
MPFVDNNGVKIHYHVEGDGPPLVLLHGLTTSMVQFQKGGYVDALKDSYKLLMMDARGHGASDQLYAAEDYEPHFMASDVIAAMDAEGIDKAHCFGYSMGARAGYSLAVYSPDRFYSFVLGGQHPFARTAEQKADDVKAVVRWEQRRDAILAGEESRRDPKDYDVFIAFRKKIMDWPPFEVEQIAKGLQVPVLLFTGEADERNMLTKEFAGQLPNARFFSLPGLNHDQAFLHKEQVLPHVVEFLAKVQRSLNGSGSGQ